MTTSVVINNPSSLGEWVYSYQCVLNAVEYLRIIEKQFGGQKSEFRNLMAHKGYLRLNNTEIGEHKYSFCSDNKNKLEIEVEREEKIRAILTLNFDLSNISISIIEQNCSDKELEQILIPLSPPGFESHKSLKSQR